MRPNAVAVTTEEGGPFIPFPCEQLNGPKGITVHSIHFDDGSVWDAFNGWRSTPPAPEPKSRPTLAKVFALIALFCFGTAFGVKLGGVGERAAAHNAVCELEPLQ